LKRIPYARRYVQSIQACISSCSAIDNADRRVATRNVASSELWIVGRGVNRAGLPVFGEDPASSKSMQLVSGGELELFIYIREKHAGHEVVSYRIAITSLPPNPNDIQSFRYDRSEGRPTNDGWDEEIQDNPKHPWAHMHINFTADNANACRMPTGNIEPLLLLRTFDHWYCSQFT